MKLQGARELCTLEDMVSMEIVTTRLIWQKKIKTVKEDLEFGYFFKCCYQHEHSASLHWMYCSSHFHVTLASHVKRFTDTNFCSDVSPFICLFIPRVISMQPKWVSKSQKRKNESSFKNCLQSCMWRMLIFGIVMLICWVCVCVSSLWQGHCYTLAEVSLCGGRLRICMKFSVSVMHLSWLQDSLA